MASLADVTAAVQAASASGWNGPGFVQFHGKDVYDERAIYAILGQYLRHVGPKDWAHLRAQNGGMTPAVYRCTSGSYLHALPILPGTSDYRKAPAA